MIYRMSSEMQLPATPRVCTFCRAVSLSGHLETRGSIASPAVSMIVPDPGLFVFLDYDSLSEPQIPPRSLKRLQYVDCSPFTTTDPILEDSKRCL